MCNIFTEPISTNDTDIPESTVHNTCGGQVTLRVNYELAGILIFCTKDSE